VRCAWVAAGAGPGGTFAVRVGVQLRDFSNHVRPLLLTQDEVAAHSFVQ
jgi:hypothetical protein